MTSVSSPNFSRALRLGVAAVGGYVFTTSAIALICTVLPYLGIAKTEAASLAGILGLLIYPLSIFFTLISQHLLRLTIVLSLCTSLMLGTALLLAREML